MLDIEPGEGQGGLLGLFSQMITSMTCALVAESQDIHIPEGSMTHEIYGATQVAEKYNCGYSLNPKYRRAFEQSDLRCAGHNGEGDVRLVELPGHPFFLATLFQPQLSSTKERPHPLIVAFINEAARFGRDH